jgi:hypothetical protein
VRCGKFCTTREKLRAVKPPYVTAFTATDVW